MPQQKGLKNDKAYRWRVAAVVAIGLFMAILDTTIVSVTLPQMQKAFHTDFELICCAASIVLALIVGRDPAVRAY
jgi:FtsH-binding integral membrane protein